MRLSFLIGEEGRSLAVSMGATGTNYARKSMEEVLKRNNFTFKKRYGQNFLTDSNLLGAIVSDAGVDKSTTVLEIGAGAGALTRVLSARAGRVISYEIDKTLRPVLAETLSAARTRKSSFAISRGRICARRSARSAGTASWRIFRTMSRRRS